MKSAIILLERGTVIPKHIWRDPGCRRSLTAIDVEHLITDAWRSNNDAGDVHGSITVPLEADGSTKRHPLVQAIQSGQKGRIGVFDISFLAPDRVKVVLREETCLSRVGSPRRQTRQIALLRPWKLVRVLLNGRSSSYSGQHYLLWEYHLVLCSGPAPDRLGLPRLLDLQADLF